MNKKVILVIIALIVLSGVIFYTYKHLNIYPSPNTAQVDPKQVMTRGQIMEVNGGSITVAGVVMLSGHEKNRIIKFTLTPQTIFNKKVFIIPKNAKSGGIPFTVQTKEVQGTIADLMIGRGIIKIQSKEDLSIVTNATALNISYETIEKQK